MSDRPLVIIGSGLLGTATAQASPGGVHVAQRGFEPRMVPRDAAIVVASGWSAIRNDDPESKLRSELDDVERVLDVAHRRGARIVIVGSADVCGLAEVVRGSTPVDPVTRYGSLKARREALVVDAVRSGVDAVAVRLAPTHGPGKPQTDRLLRLARRPVLALPNGGRYSVGFVTLGDAVAAFRSLVEEPVTGVVSVGGGPTQLRTLMRTIAEGSGRRRFDLPVPVPAVVAVRLARSRVPTLAWVGRFTLPRAVMMEADVTPQPIGEAVDYLMTGLAAPTD